MTVYSDPSYTAPLAALLQRLEARLCGLSTTSSLDEARNFLVQAGQVEQAVEDGDISEDIRRQCRTVTERAAAMFLAFRADGDRFVALQTVARTLQELARPATPVTMKAPEGFAYYGLFPEAFCEAALCWLSDYASAENKKAVVIGIRTIGTTLSAVVAEELKAAHWDVHRFTLRPFGHPFAREACVATDDLNNAEWCLIVDEGPGLSGSSMASVAEAVVRAGLARDRISFFPGHAGEPGIHASEGTRRWWASTPRYVVPSKSLRWSGRSLIDALAAISRQWNPSERAIARVEDLSAGQWRSLLFPEEEWPATATPFERAKYRVVFESGAAVFWKFEGFASLDEGVACEAVYRKQESRWKNGWTPEPLGTAFGFVATRWIEGTPLASTDATPGVLDHLARYIVSVSRPPLPFDEAEQALERLRRAACPNLSIQADSAPTCGDACLAPHKWIRTKCGEILKTDCYGHAWEHTSVGEQSVYWAIAGVLVEWRLNDPEARLFLRRLEEAGGWTILQDVLRAYCEAYAMFQANLFEQAQAHPIPQEERDRLERGKRAYLADLSRFRERTPAL